MTDQIERLFTARQDLRARTGMSTTAAVVAVAAIVAVITIVIAGVAALTSAPDGSRTLYAVLGLAVFVLMVGAALAARGIAASIAAARVERELLAAMLDADGTALAVSTPNGKARCLNAAFKRLGGRPGQPLLSVVEPLFMEAPENFAALRRAAGAGETFSVDTIRSPNSGLSPTCHRVSVTPLPGHEGHLLWLVEEIEPIPPAPRAETLVQAPAWLSSLDHLPGGLYVLDADGGIVFANETLAQWLGRNRVDLLGERRRLADFVVCDPGEPTPFDGEVFGEGQQRCSVLLEGAEGRRLRAYVAQTCVTGQDGRLLAQGVMFDQTSDEQWQQALDMSEQRFQRIFEDAPIGIVLVDGNGRIAECNSAFESMIDAAGGALRERALLDLVKPESRGTVQSHLAHLGDETSASAPVEIRLNGTQDRVAQLYVRRLGHRSDPGSNLILHFIDMTKQKNLEVQFSQSSKMQTIGQLAGGIAHDFNNLLTAMIGFCDLLLLRHKPGDQSFSDIMQIKQNANRAANLVRQLLAFSRQQTLQPRVLNITDVLTELSNLLRRLIGENIELRMIHGRDLGLVKVDQGQLEQVIINLAVNARDAMVGGGRLTVVTSNVTLTAPARCGHDDIAPGEYVLIEVIDTGHGIAKEHLSRIFEPFFSTKAIGQGTGLGLSTVYGIVRQTGGFVSVESEVGQGTKFSIYLPRHRVAAGQAAPGEPEDQARLASDLTGAGTILLVEDEDAVRVFGARALRNKGYRVLEARSVESALEILASEPGIDLLVTDVVMHEMDGPTLINQVRKSRPNLKVIFISGYTEDRFRDQVDAGAVIHFLPKPFTLKQLAAKVKDVMAGS